MFKRYRVRDCSVEAVQWRAEMGEIPGVSFQEDGTYRCGTIEIGDGEWIVRGVTGLYFVCRDFDFKERYYSEDFQDAVLTQTYVHRLLDNWEMHKEDPPISVIDCTIALLQALLDKGVLRSTRT